MTQKIKGYILMFFSIILLMGLAGGVELMQPDVGYKEWAVVLIVLIVAAVSGLVGFSYTQEE